MQIDFGWSADGAGWADASTADHPKSIRSEEHTSELQSRGHLVCRLLLEKKKDGERSSSPARRDTSEERRGEVAGKGKVGDQDEGTGPGAEDDSARGRADGAVGLRDRYG